MGSTETLRAGQIVRYTDPDGNQWDAIIREIDGEQAFIKYRPTWHDRHQWVDVDALEVPGALVEKADLDAQLNALPESGQRYALYFLWGATTIRDPEACRAALTAAAGW